jgi:prepilin-type N-terminal cleavage/methylation domain-containing protein
MNKKGFTLIELLAVIAIIGLLSTLAVVALGSARQKARDSKRLSDLKQVQTALELYFTDTNAYPAGTDLILGSTSTKCLGASGFAASCTSGTVYMGLVPSEPSPGQGPYTYSVLASSTAYTITAQLEGTINDLSGSITASQNGLQKTQ